MLHIHVENGKLVNHARRHRARKVTILYYITKLCIPHRAKVNTEFLGIQTSPNYRSQPKK